MRRRGQIAALLGCCAGACASTAAQDTHPDDAASLARQTLRTAPTCGSNGPHVVATVVGFIKGKPPHHSFEVELHVLNPLNRPIWVAHAMDESLPLEVDRVSVSRTSWKQLGPAWSFGSGSLEAVRVAPGADFNLTGVLFESFSFDSPDLMTVSFLDEVRLDGRPAVDWVGRRTEAAARADIDLQSLRESDDLPVGKGARLEVEVRCSQRIDVHDPKLQKWGSPTAR
jgi:hypothetical protein